MDWQRETVYERRGEDTTRKIRCKGDKERGERENRKRRKGERKMKNRGKDKIRKEKWEMEGETGRKRIVKREEKER